MDDRVIPVHRNSTVDDQVNRICFAEILLTEARRITPVIEAHPALKHDRGESETKKRALLEKMGLGNHFSVAV